MAVRDVHIDKNNFRELGFDQPIVNIGSHPENDVVLTGQNIIAFHAMVIAQDGIFQLTRLSPQAQIHMDGVAVAEENINLTENQHIAIGDQMLSFRRNGKSGGIYVSVFGSVAGQSPVSTNWENTILVNVLSQHSEVQVAQSAVYELEVVNAGPIVAGFSVSLQGVPNDWIEITPSAFNLNERQRATVTITVTPPRHPSSVAGKHSIRALISSPNYSGSQVATPLDLIIEPYYEFSLGNLSPKQQNIFWRMKRGKVGLPITNLGNSPADFTVLAYDDENGCTFDFQLSDELQPRRQAILPVQAGVTFNLPIEITPIKQPVFSMRSRRYQYTTTVSVAQQAVSQQVVSGAVTNYPLFGWWSIVLSVLAILVGLFILVQPRIQNFSVASGKDVIELGDTTKLEWKVSPFATRVTISNVDKAITYGQTSLTVAPKESTTYELVAGNWLSGLLGLDRHDIETVLVVPPSPTVNVFEVDKTEVPKGTPVNLRWSVTQADNAVLTVGGVVYDLPPDKFSGEQSVVLEKDSLVTLDARNASGNELRSYFINVVEPSIQIQTFTIWVRPDATAATLQEQPLLATAPTLHHIFSKARSVRAVDSSCSTPEGSPIASDGFTEKYVLLVLDRVNGGYRVVPCHPERELSKGEQVMVEWNVDGTNDDTVQIAPFTDALPSKGRQPFFPQASMNFVLTAQSGEKKELYMLPVVVFDGQPPVAPKIDIFRASPMSSTGPANVQFTWSVSGEWTRIELSSGKSGTTTNLNPEGFKSIHVSTSDTFILKAWNGTLSSSQAIDITINPALLDPGLLVDSISPTTGRAQVGSKLTVTVKFGSIPAGGASPTGTVTVTDGSATCQITLPATSCTLQFTTSGTKTISASFPGDQIYHQSQSPGFAQQVVVASSQVDLTPTFYFNGSTVPIAVESSMFDMDKGLHVIVEVRPINTVLADNNGNISVSICNQSAAGTAINSTCSFVGAAQVKVASAPPPAGQTAGYGYADIVIQNFTVTGLHALLFEYTHATNAIDPTSITQPNIHINRSRLLLSLASCASPYSFTSCNFGLTANVTPEISFDLSIPGSNGPVLLSSLLPAPQVSAFTISSTSHPATIWTCQIKVVSGTYKLVCTVTGAGLVSGTTYTVRYGYDNTNPLPGSGATNDYYMGTDPSIPFSPTSFQLKVLSSTRVLIGNLNGIRVGERILLTGPSDGLVSILNGANTRIFPSTGLTLVAKNSQNASDTDIFGVENEGTNCARNNGDGSTIVVTAINANCYIYFKHVGNYSLVATFSGDASNNGSSSGDTPVTVLKQDQISAVIQYLSPTTGTYSSTFPTSWVTNRSLLVRTVLTGPASNFSSTDTSFPPTALVDRKLLITLNPWATTNCVINTTTGSLVTSVSSGVYEVQITQKNIPDPTQPDPTQLQSVTSADFDIQCTQPDSLGLSFTLTFSDQTTPHKDSDDFGFAQSPVGKFNIPITLPSLGSMVVSVQRQDSANTEMVSGTSIGKLHFGQRYSVGITGSSTISAPYEYTVDYTYTYLYPSTGGYSYTVTTNVDPTTASNNAQAAKLNQYSTNAKWTVDPANFLNLGTSLGTGNTCTSNMAMTAVSSGTPSEYWYSSWLGTSYYYSGTTLVYVLQIRRYNYGSLNVQLSTSAAQKCTLVFDSTVNNPITATTGTIAVNAQSGDGLFVVNSTYNVLGIDKQAVSMTFSPSTATSVNIPTALPVGISLASSDITGGTALAFVGTTFSSNFSPTNDSSCSNMSSTGSLSPLSITYTSTSPYSACNNTLQYLGNKYYKATGSLSLPTMTFIDPIPTITNVTSSLANGSYKAGQVVPIQVTFSEPVTVTGTPQLTLSTGSPATTAVNYSSGTGTATLTFNYTVAAGNTSSDLDYASTGALVLNGGTIRDANNNATLTLASPGAAGSLGANKAIVIDTTAPTVTINQAAAQTDPTAAGATTINFTVVFSESVTGFSTNSDVTVSGTAGGTLTATITGSGTTYNVAVSGMSTPPNAGGTVIVSVIASAATDAAGNGNAASTSTDNTVTWAP